MGSPSKYAKNPKKAKDILRSMERTICDHRDGDNGKDVTLCYKGFQHFVDQCNNAMLIPTMKEFTLIQHMCTYMSKYMPKEETKQPERMKQPEGIRQDIFIRLMNQYLQNPIVTNDDEVKQFYNNPKSNKLPPKGIMKKGDGKLDGYINPCKCVILEVKNESGQGGGSDSYAQVIAYYVKTLKK